LTWERYPHAVAGAGGGHVLARTGGDRPLWAVPWFVLIGSHHVLLFIVASLVPGWTVRVR